MLTCEQYLIYIQPAAKKTVVSNIMDIFYSQVDVAIDVAELSLEQEIRFEIS